VLFHDGLPPAIIDFTPYWRPVGYASAIVVADALVWEGATKPKRYARHCPHTARGVTTMAKRGKHE
jgi:hypothetical protein